jgi:ribonuclease R
MPKARIYPYDEARLAQLGEQCSLTERRADEATRDVTNWLKCEFMRERVGETFPGVITAVTGFGIFVELTDIYVEGLVHVTALPGDYYHFDAVHHRLAGERTGRSFRLGDTVEVVVARVDLDERKIDFELSDNVLSAPIGRKKRGEKAEPVAKGKAAKGRAPKAVAAKDKPARAPRAVADDPYLAPDVAVQPRKRKVGVVQALPSVAPEMLAKADEMLGNTDVRKSREVKKALLEEAKVGGNKPAAGKGKGAPAAGKPRNPSKQKARSAKPSKHRKGSAAPKAGATGGAPASKRKAKK